MYLTLEDVPSGALKRRLMQLPGISYLGTTKWIERDEFPRYGFKTFGCFRRGTPEGFPQGLLWETRRSGRKILAIRAVGFDPEFDKPRNDAIRPDIHRRISSLPCIITGTRTQVEVDHRAGNKTHPAHSDALNPTTQSDAHFMPLCRVLNDIKREACKKCVSTGLRPELPPFLGGGDMPTGEGCQGCFWYEPEAFGATI